MLCQAEWQIDALITLRNIPEELNIPAGFKLFHELLQLLQPSYYKIQNKRVGKKLHSVKQIRNNKIHGIFRFLTYVTA